MGGLVSGALHAPLTGIFLIAEITGGYALFIPLMIVSAMSYFVTRFFEPNSVYKKTLVERGYIRGDKEGELLHSTSISQILETDFHIINPDKNLRQLVHLLGVSERTVFPVVNNNGILEGLVSFDDLKEVMFNTALYDSLLVKDLMHVPEFICDESDNLEKVMSLFDEHSVWNIPVTNKNLYSGFVSKSGLLNYYRNRLLLENQGKI